MIHMKEENIYLRKISEKVPFFPETVHLAKLEEGNLIDLQPSESMTISDHQPFFVQTKYLNVGIFNIQNPGSPVSPMLSPVGRNGLYKLYYKQDMEIQMKMIAQYIVNMFLHEQLSALMLQEVPDPNKNTYNFDVLYMELKRLSEAHDVSLDLNSFRSVYRSTRKNKDQSHKFGCTVLVNKKFLCVDVNSVKSICGKLNERVFICRVEDNSGRDFFLTNIHGNYVDSIDLADYIVEVVNGDKIGNNILGGDLNIPITSEKAIEKIRAVKSGACILLPSKNQHIPESKNTLDGIFVSQDAFPVYLRKQFFLLNGVSGGW